MKILKHISGSRIESRIEVEVFRSAVFEKDVRKQEKINLLLIIIIKKYYKYYIRLIKN